MRYYLTVDEKCSPFSVIAVADDKSWGYVLSLVDTLGWRKIEDIYLMERLADSVQGRDLVYAPAGWGIKEIGRLEVVLYTGAGGPKESHEDTSNHKQDM